MMDFADDVRQHRDWLISLASIPEAGTVVDLGCGRGEDLHALAALHPHPRLRFVGVDGHEASVAIASERARSDTRVTFRQARLDGRLPFADETIDVVYSHNLLECLPDPDAFAAEVARILRPGGQVVIGHWDWDSQLFDGTDTALIRRLVHGYADWQQAWMDHADGWMGRRLWGVLQSTGYFTGIVHARALTNTIYAAPWFGHANAQAFRSLARRGLVSPEDVERFERDQIDLDEHGRYFYSITGYAYVGRRRTPGQSSAAPHHANFP